MDDELLPPPPPPPASSQASSHLPLEPVSGALLYREEAARRSRLRRRGSCRTGCAELDEQVLLGGFERGCVAGVSAEDEEVALLIGLQTIARLLAEGEDGREDGPRAMIVTTLANSALLPKLRAAVVAQVAAAGDRGRQVRRCLERVAVSRVFDLAGLWEVLGELDAAASPADEATEAGPESPAAVDLREAGPPTPMRTPTPSPAQRSEIMDSEEEEDGLSPLGSSGVGGPAEADTAVGEQPPPPPPPQTQPRDQERGEPAGHATQASSPRRRPPPLPDIVLVTHMSQLLSAYFAQRERPAAHAMLQLLASHLRYVTRSPEHGGPLVMILNSTASSSASSGPTGGAAPGAASAAAAAGGGDHHQPPPPPDGGAARPPRGARPPDPTLRSIFHPAPPPAVAGGRYYQQGMAAAAEAQRRSKPSFGLVFAQLLDLHLLCTRVPRTRADAGAALAGGGGGEEGVGYAWVVEVLLDEIGVWEGDDDHGGGEKAAEEGGRGPRRSREQRWGAVDVRRGGDGGTRVVDAFPPEDRRAVGEVRVAGGFGGRRV